MAAGAAALRQPGALPGSCVYDDFQGTVIIHGGANSMELALAPTPRGVVSGGVSSGGHAENIADVVLKVYLKVMNENFSQGPLYAMDTFRFDWRWGDGGFRLQRVVQNPPDYPALSP